MNIKCKWYFSGTVTGLALGGVILAALALVSDPPEKPMVTVSRDICARIMPEDKGQLVMLKLHDNQDGGYSLYWEKHQVVTFGMASIPEGKD